MGRPLLLLGFAATLLISAVVVVQAHGGHHHSHEPAHHKYSKAVNEATQEELKREDDHAHSHGHSHESHEHSHEGGGCPHSHGSYDHAHSHSHSHSHEKHHGHSHSESETAKNKRSIKLHQYNPKGMLNFMNDASNQLWVYAIGSTLLISAAPCLLLSIIPVQSNEDNGPLLKVLLSFGAGGLLGDAFLHLIPHATPAGSHSHSHSHSAEAGHSHEPHDMSVGLFVLAGIIAFLFIEKFVRIIRGEDGHGHSHGGHGHSHAITAKKKEKCSDDESEVSKKGKEKKNSVDMKPEEEHYEGMRVAAYLNLAADFAHNFTDGLAIGASFIAGPNVGLVTMVAVLFHEVPHEIGDFAILIQSGCSKKKAMLMQLMTALGALAGCVLSLWSADPSALAEAATSSWVLPFTAGGFIYIATVTIMPELLEKSSFKESVYQVFAMGTGILAMYLIALYE
ncbi:hypothetical protein L596_014759 [Steinernema carpocapsae]|uniref:Zinc transporter n=1 Tax=Steinernema carpocapsae TaxID=34508 RepID=A0A4U5ND31_STECR|nr:hypothetical protein L596_014759 [Steinernema carpocapsae]